MSLGCFIDYSKPIALSQDIGISLLRNNKSITLLRKGMVFNEDLVYNGVLVYKE